MPPRYRRAAAPPVVASWPSPWLPLKQGLPPAAVNVRVDQQQPQLLQQWAGGGAEAVCRQPRASSLLASTRLQSQGQVVEQSPWRARLSLLVQPPLTAREAQREAQRQAAAAAVMAQPLVPLVAPNLRLRPARRTAQQRQAVAHPHQ